jgi:long-subunit acyl-CoA synthetase (AMP-forming)
MQKEINTIINLVLSKDSTLHIKPEELLDYSKKLLKRDYSDKIIHSFLELGHFPQINAMFYQSKLQKEWLNNLFSLINKSKYNTGILFQQRVKRYPDHTLFQIINGKKITTISYQEAWNKIKTIALSILKLTHKSDQPVIGLYSPNSIESALVDLACLSFNVKIVPIPANISKEHFKYIIKHADITHLFVGGNEQANLISNIPNELSSISTILLPITSVSNINHILWKDFIQKYSDNDEADLIHRFQITKMDDDATIMYTSGTTANPKGIIFTQTNIITKRFARALALPDINSNDNFLCYLPLYHTFGRYLEMMGAIFWGATYTFAESPSFKSLLKNMQIAKPSIFISIPKRWLQLYELFTSNITISSSDEREILSMINKTTGGKLRLGLSAAGYLDPDIFKFFYLYDIHLLSGYGMTEATGGITMTLQNDYVKDSVGIPLPGIELKINNDKELLLRGPYIISHYHGKNKTSAHVNGWFHTGDIFEEKTNHYFIVDRKKEIYKNSRGLTISPQKIENMFQDFDAVKSVFLVGDGKAYNTVLLYPDKDWVKTLEHEKDFNLQEYCSSLLQSVNSFLASYERIVNFAIIDRNFSAEKGELTPKKTFKRKTILNNFYEYIYPMYENDYNSFLYETNEVRIPKWLLRKSGIIANDLIWDGKILSIRNNEKSLELKFNELIVKIGDYTYKNSNNYLDINKLVISPDLWLGNQQFVDFFGFSAISPKHFELPSELEIDLSKFKFQSKVINKQTIENLKHALREKVFDLNDINNAAIIIYNEYGYNLSTAINYLSKILVSDKHILIEIVVTLLTRLRFHPSFKTRVKTVEILTPNINGELFIELLSEIYLASDDPKILKEITLDIRVLKEDHFKCILNKLANLRHEVTNVNPRQLSFIEALLNTITEYGIMHPTDYQWARSELVKWNLSSAPDTITSLTSTTIDKLVSGFRKWLGSNRNIAIDQESGEEYSWKETIVFDPNVSDKYKESLFDAISKTQLLKEAIFLISKHHIVQLDDIQLRGVWVMFLGQNHGKSVFRVTIQTRDHNNHNFVINLNEDQTDEFIRNEIKWLIITGSSSRGRKLVEDFGGYWPEYKIFTEEYVQGETLYQYLERNQNQINSQEMEQWLILVFTDVQILNTILQIHLPKI